MMLGENIPNKQSEKLYKLLEEIDKETPFTGGVTPVYWHIVGVIKSHTKTKDALKNTTDVGLVG